MILYRIAQFADHRLPILTYFRTSLQAAKKMASQMQDLTAQPGLIVISKINLDTALKAEDWIDLLEGDAPGLQDQNRTPVDLITEAVEVWRKEWTS
jgi:hypothetical protein